MNGELKWNCVHLIYFQLDRHFPSVYVCVHRILFAMINFLFFLSSSNIEKHWNLASNSSDVYNISLYETSVCVLYSFDALVKLINNLTVYHLGLFMSDVHFLFRCFFFVFTRLSTLNILSPPLLILSHIYSVVMHWTYNGRCAHSS